MPLPQYLPYARFLLDADLSHTAKLLYTRLRDRATLSQKNHWVDAQGHIYVIYPLSHLAKDLGCCISSVLAKSTPTTPPPCVSGQSGRKQNENRRRASRTTHSRKEKAYKDDRKNFGTATIQYSRKCRRLLWHGWIAVLRKMSYAKGRVLRKRRRSDGQEQAPH